MAQGMCVYLMIRRKKTTIFTDAKETTNVSELKKIIQGTHIGQKVEMYFSGLITPKSCAYLSHQESRR